MKWFVKPLLAREGLEVSTRQTCVVGTFVAECFWTQGPMPIVTIWLRWDDPAEMTTLRILNMYVPASLRRLGLMGWTFEQVLSKAKHCRFVVTDRGTEFSEPWLIKRGFKHGRSGWTLKISCTKLAV